MKTVFLIGALGVSILSASGADREATHKIIQTPGRYSSPDNTCQASITISGMGGHKVLKMSGENVHRAEIADVTGALWLDKSRLAYTVSPIYGKPGVFIFDCALVKSKNLLGPQHRNKGYPNGSDYFELQGYSPNGGGKLFFFYVSDVDLTDFKKFRNSEFLYQIDLRGHGFKKVLK